MKKHQIIEQYIQNNPDWVQKLIEIKKMRENSIIFPTQNQILRPFQNLTAAQVKVVIIGQDPYHTPGVANGLAFGIDKNSKIPPSLINIKKEIKQDLNQELSDFSLEQWQAQGVLLINTILTVEKGKPLSHQKIGWQELVIELLKKIEKVNKNIIYLALGEHAKKVSNLICKEPQRIIETSHPSPLGAYRGFNNSQVFSKVNNQLIRVKRTPIKWGKEQND